MYRAWAPGASCPVPQVRTARRRLVRVARTYSTEAPGRTCQLRVPLPRDASAEPRRVVGILGEAPEVAPASTAVRAREAWVDLSTACAPLPHAQGCGWRRAALTSFAGRWGRCWCSALGTGVRWRRSGRRSGPARSSPSPGRPRRAVACCSSTPRSTRLVVVAAVNLLSSPLLLAEALPLRQSNSLEYQSPFGLMMMQE